MTLSPRRILLVRHAEIEESYRVRCYGASDVPLSEQGRRDSQRIADELAVMLADAPVRYLLHSGMSRTREMAELIATKLNLPMIVDSRLAELNFGIWELQPWDLIHATTGEAMVRLVDEPDTFCPEGGETIHAMRDRMLAWHRELPAEGLIIAISHGGPIAALRGTLAGLTVGEWLALIPKHGTIVSIEPAEPLPVVVE